MLTYLHGDHLGSTSLTTDANGDFVARVLYYPYGETRYEAGPGGTAGTLPTDYGFTGQRKEDFGLYDYRARFYDPTLGRFISADTIVPNPGNPQDFNRYAYVRNNPVLYTDFSGNRPCGPACREDITTYEVFRCNGTQCWNQSAPEYGVGWGNGQGFDAHDAETVAFTVVCLTGVGLAEYVLLGGGAVTTAKATGIAACADGDCTNEAQYVAETLSADGDPTNEAVAVGKSGLDVFARASEFGVRTYNSLKGAIKGTGLQAHHIIEKRFARIVGVNPGQMQSVALTPEEHRTFTNMWRAYIGYDGSNAAITTSTATVEDIWFAAQQIYADSPELLEAARRSLFGQ